MGQLFDTIRRLVAAVHAYRDANGYWVLWADAEEVTRLRALQALPRTWENQERLAELRKPKPLPQRRKPTRPRKPGSP